MDNNATKEQQNDMGTVKEQRITYVFYKDWSEVIETMPAEMELQVRRAIDAYAFSNEEIALPLAAKYFFQAIKQDIDRDRQRFEDTRQKRKDAINKRWNNTNHTKVNKSIQTIQKNTNDTEYENEKENEKENEDEYGRDKHDMSNKKTSLSKESEVKKEPQSGNALAPSLDEVKDYILTNGIDVDAEQFYNVYQANGWVTKSGTPIKNWKAQVKTWTRNGIGNKSKGTDGQSAAPQANRTGQGYSSRGVEETKKMLDRIAEEERHAISHKEWLAQQNKK